MLGLRTEPAMRTAVEKEHLPHARAPFAVVPVVAVTFDLVALAGGPQPGAHGLTAQVDVVMLG